MTHPFQIGDTVGVDLWSPNTCGFEHRIAVVMHAYVNTIPFVPFEHVLKKQFYNNKRRHP